MDHCGPDHIEANQARMLEQMGDQLLEAAKQVARRAEGHGVK